MAFSLSSECGMDELVFLQGQEWEWLKDAVCPGKPRAGHGAPSSAVSLPPPPSLHLTPLTNYSLSWLENNAS